MVADGRFRKEDKDGNDATLQQILAGFDNPRWLSTPGEICSGSRVSGALVPALFIASWWPCPERHSAMVVNVVLRWTLWFGIMAFGPIVRNVDSGVIADLASWLALLDLLIVCGTPVIRAPLSANDVVRWLYSVVTLVQFTASFLSFRQVPFLEKTKWASMGPGRLPVCPSPPPSPLHPSLPPSPLSPRVQIRIEYKVSSSLLRSLAALGGGLAKFVPCGLEKLTAVG